MTATTIDITLKRHGDIIRIEGTGYSVTFHPKDFDKTLAALMQILPETDLRLNEDNEEEFDKQEFERQKQCVYEELTIIYTDYALEQQQKSNEKNKKNQGESQEDSKNKKNQPRIVYLQKYAADNFLAEAITICGIPCYVIYYKQTSQIEIKE